MTSERPDPSQFRRKPRPAPDYGQDVAQGDAPPPAAAAPAHTPPASTAPAPAPADTTGAEVTVQLNVRVSRHVAQVLDNAVSTETQRARSEGRTERITKRSVLENAILRQHG